MHVPILFRIRRIFRSLENPTFLSRKWPALYWAVYNFSWSTWYSIFENGLSKISPLATVAGYSIIFNDILVKDFGFKFITGNATSVLGLDVRTKLVCLYFGLVFLAAGRMIYLLRRPMSISSGPDLASWVSYCLKNFTFSDFLQLHNDIRQNQHRTLYGKYYDDDWSAFREDAVWLRSGRTQGLSDDEKQKDREQVSYSVAKERHEDLLRSILIDRYAEYSARNKVSLLFALLFSIPGTFLFLLPTADIFLTIIKSTVF